MTFRQTLLATAVAASLLSAGAEATPPALLTRTLDNSPSTAAFAGGATTDAGSTFLNLVPATAAVGVHAIIEVGADEVGEEGDLYQVVSVDDAGGVSWYQRTPTGWTGWDTRVATLMPFQSKNLAATETIELDDLESALGRSLDGAAVRAHIGYATDSTILTYSQAASFTVAAPAAGDCPGGTSPAQGGVPGGKRLCVLQGTYTADLHLPAEFDYVLSGGVFIGGDDTDRAELTIDAGTRIYGESGADFLVISRGSKIHANGSRNAPIVMTSANDASADMSTRGQWGGLIINGNAPINGCAPGTAVCEAQGEGSTGLFGGNDPHDSSGNLNYLQVRYAGYEITPENELNGIAFQAVGDGTLVDYVQVHNNSDDGMEFFGGTVNAKHLVLTGNSDDSLDWVLGWQGKVQHVVIFQTDEGDQGFEADNLDTARDSLPRSRPTIANVTMVGNASTDIGMLLREGTGGKFYNFVVTGFGESCIDIDHGATFLNAGSSATELSGELTMNDSVVDCDTNFDEELEDDWSVATWFTSQDGNAQMDADLMDKYVNSSAINARPAASLQDPFFDQVDYIGAVPDAFHDWTQGWTYRGFEEFSGGR